MGKILEIENAFGTKIYLGPKNERICIIGRKVYKNGTRPDFLETDEEPREISHYHDVIINRCVFGDYHLISILNNYERSNPTVFSGKLSHSCKPGEEVCLDDFLKTSDEGTILLENLYSFYFRYFKEPKDPARAVN